MTRGQIAIITDNGILTSAEFNGGMYPRDDGYGMQVFSELYNIEIEEQYRYYVENFNRESGFGYEGELFYTCDDSFYNMKVRYFDKWFSDYVYIKNLSQTDKTFTDSKGRRITLAPDDRAVFNFGEIYATCDEDIVKRNLIAELNALKEELSYDFSDNYSKIWSLCADYDNEQQDRLYLTDRITERDFVDEEILEYIVTDKAQKGDVQGLRHFLSDTSDDELYILDGYGNLRNCEIDDFEGLIMDIVYELENSMNIPEAGMDMGG